MGTQDCSSPAAQRTMESHDKLLQEHATQDASQKQGKTRIPFSYLEIFDYNQCNDCPALVRIKCRTELSAKGIGFLSWSVLVFDKTWLKSAIIRTLTSRCAGSRWDLLSADTAHLHCIHPGVVPEEQLPAF